MRAWFRIWPAVAQIVPTVPPRSRCWLQSLAGRAKRQNALAPPCGEAKLSSESRRILHKTVEKSPLEIKAGPRGWPVYGPPIWHDDCLPARTRGTADL